MRFPALPQWKTDGNSVKLESSIVCLYIYISRVHKLTLPFWLQGIDTPRWPFIFYGWGVTMPDIAFLRWQIVEWSLFACIWIWPLESAGGIHQTVLMLVSHTNISSLLFFLFLFRWSWEQQRKSCKNLFTEKAPWMSTKMFQFTKRETPLEHKWGS